jgi:hypothetical protein
MDRKILGMSMEEYRGKTELSCNLLPPKASATNPVAVTLFAETTHPSKSREIRIQIEGLGQTLVVTNSASAKPAEYYDGVRSCPASIKKLNGYREVLEMVAEKMKKESPTPLR